jgi:hypothetical protein
MIKAPNSTFGGCDRAVYGRGSTSFRPKTNASTDQLPGPIIANVAPSTATNMRSPALPGDMKATQASRISATRPAIGVHKPAISRTPTTAPMLSARTVEQTGVEMAQVMAAIDERSASQQPLDQKPGPRPAVCEVREQSLHADTVFSIGVAQWIRNTRCCHPAVTLLGYSHCSKAQ